MPTPAATSMTQINTHIGSNRNSLGDSYVRNLANIQSGAIKYGNCRWGIQFPAYQVFSGGSSLSYNSTPDISCDNSYYYPLNWESVQSYGQAWIQYILNSNGTAVIRSSNNQYGDTDAASWTWLNGGSAGDYTARFDLNSGTLWSSSATGTDLALSTTRAWGILAESNWNGTSWSPNPGTASADGTLTIKDSSGNTLITRGLSFYAEANMQSL